MDFPIERDPAEAWPDFVGWRVNYEQAELSRVISYDDESMVNDEWIRQRYDCGCYPTFAPARCGRR